MIKFSTGYHAIEWREDWVDVSSEFFEAVRAYGGEILPTPSDSSSVQEPSIIQWTPVMNPVVALAPLVTKLPVKDFPEMLSTEQSYWEFQSLLKMHLQYVESQLLFGTIAAGDPIDGIWTQMIAHHVPIYHLTTTEFFDLAAHRPGVYLGDEDLLRLSASVSSEALPFYSVAGFRSHPRRVLQIQGTPLRGFVYTPRLDLQESTWFTMQQNFFTVEFGVMTQCAIQLEDLYVGIHGYELRDFAPEEASHATL